MSDSRVKPSLALAHDVNKFFQKGAHDLQNVFQSLNVWVATQSSTDQHRAVDLLNELQGFYAQEIAQLRDSFDQLLSIHHEEALVSINVLEATTALLNELIPSFQPINVAVENAIPTDLMVDYPKSHLTGALRAVLDNALRYRKPDSPLHLRLSAHSTAGSTIISIQDDGTGINMSYYGQQVFEAFTRCTDQSEGQGISLHLVKVMLNRHGGSVKFSSKPGQGTSVELALGAP